MFNDDYNIEILDANAYDMTRDEAAERIKSYDPQIIGVSVLANAYKNTAFKVLEMAKAHNQDIVTVIGGVFVTTRPEAAMACPDIDYGVMGEGEYVFPKLVEYICNKTGDLPAEGIVYRKSDAGLAVIPQKTFIANLDDLPAPRYSLVDYSKYSHIFRNSVEAPRALPYGKIVTSRGCPIGCVFCQVENISGKTTRYESAGKVIDDIQYLIDAYGIKAIEFEDDNFLGSRTRSRQLLKMMIERNWDLVWNAMNVSVFYLTEELLNLMSASKCQYLSMAIESGSPRVLKEIVHKPVNLKHAKKMASHARKLGIDTTALFVIGFPGETWDEIRQTFKFAEELGADYVKFNVATAFPGTKLHKLALSTKSLDASFDFDNIKWGSAGISTNEFSAKQLTAARGLEWDRINFSSLEKKDKIAKMMHISLEELEKIRRQTLR
ncbi:MAG: B12-binding domain-containing radical SAM protein [Elusimicrobia bacterium]|nr:B12-binding domain-containing radical SAM protein [Elusimicrobiota bacterium]